MYKNKEKVKKIGFHPCDGMPCRYFKILFSKIIVHKGKCPICSTQKRADMESYIPYNHNFKYVYVSVYI